MMKRKVSLFLALAMGASILAGCGGASSGEQSTSASQEGAKVDTLKILSQYDAFDPNNEAEPKAEPGRILEEITGQKVEYYMLPAENSNEKLYIEVSGNADYNILKLRKEQYDTLVSQGALLDIRSYLEQYAPNIMAEGAISEDIWKTVEGENGEIYGIPEKNSYDHITNCIAYRKDILDKYGIPVPVTTEDFYNANKQLAEAGVKSPTVTALPLMHGVTGAFGLVNDWNEENGQLVYKGMSEGLDKYAEYMRSLYQVGGFGKDPFGTLNNGDALARFANGDAAFLMAAWWNAPALEKDMTAAGVENAIDQIGWIQSLEGPDGTKGVFRDKGVSYVIAIPRYMENTAQASIEYINKKFEEDIVTEYVLGEEGKQFVVENGEYRPGPEYRKEARADWYLTGIPETLWEKYWPASIYNNVPQYAAWNSIQEKADEFGVYDVMKLSPPISSWGNAKAVMNAAVDEQLNLFINGNIDSLDNLRATLKAEGIEQATADVNAWYAEFNK